jgi:hypothetical protein
MLCGCGRELMSKRWVCAAWSSTCQLAPVVDRPAMCHDRVPMIPGLLVYAVLGSPARLHPAPRPAAMSPRPPAACPAPPPPPSRTHAHAQASTRRAGQGARHVRPGRQGHHRDHRQAERLRQAAGQHPVQGPGGLAGWHRQLLAPQGTCNPGRSTAQAQAGPHAQRSAMWCSAMQHWPARCMVLHSATLARPPAQPAEGADWCPPELMRPPPPLPRSPS